MKGKVLITKYKDGTDESTKKYPRLNGLRGEGQVYCYDISLSNIMRNNMGITNCP